MSEFISKINDNGKDYIIRDAAAAPIESPNLRGVPTAPTAAQETKNDQIATTAFVHGLVNNNIDSKLGNPGGIATLDENGNIPSSQLPSYVDDVLDGTYDKENDQFLNLNGEIYSPESSKIYIDVNTRVTYRWTGTTYAEIASSLALGTTAATAFPGNRGLALEQEVAALSQGTVTYRGTIGTDGDIVKLPTTYKRGDMYRVVTEGTYSEQECEVGDFLFCTRDNILTVAALPSYDKNRFKRYIMYQKYNPQTGANGEIIFAAYSFYMMGTAYLNRVYYDIKDNVKQLYSPDSFYVYYHSTTDNGVTWTALNHHYGDLKEAIFTETETEAIRILNTVEEIYNNENAIIYSPNPWGLSGYATDWAVIQGNLEDIVSEGAIYIDPDETSSEIENIDSVTSAKLVSYDNTKSGLESTNVQEALDEVNNYLQRTPSKNLVKITTGNCTFAGLTITVNEDKSITVNGTSTTTTGCDFGSATLDVDKEYIFTGLPTGLPSEISSNVAVRLRYYSDESGTTNFVTCTEEGISFVNKKKYSTTVTFTVFKRGIVFDNVTFYPMVRLASIEDDTYEPYIEDTMEVVNNALVHGDVVDNLLSTATNLPLSANQGKILSDKISIGRQFRFKDFYMNSSGKLYIRFPHTPSYLPGGFAAYKASGPGNVAAALFVRTTNSYSGNAPGFVVPLVTYDGCSFSMVRMDRPYFVVNVTGAGSISLWLDDTFDYYIGDTPAASDTVWTTVS